MANPFDVRVVNPLEALMLGEQGYNDQRASVSRQRASDALASGDTRSALAQLISANDPRMVQALGAYEAQANTVYGTPIYGTRPNGETALGTFDKRGQFREIATPGFTPTPGIRTIDTGTGTVVLDSRSGRPVSGNTMQPGQPAPGMPQAPQQPAGYIPKDVAGEAQQKEQGQGAGKAAFSLPNTIATIDHSLSVIDGLKKHPGRATATGVSGVADPRNYFPGTRAKDFQVMLRQLEGQTFLQQYNELRGAGAITEAEGAKATTAKARLDRAQSDGEFLQALTDLEDVLVTGRARAIQMAQRPQVSAPPQGGAGLPPPPKMGELRDGYRYKGGDPSSPESWVNTRLK